MASGSNRFIQYVKQTLPRELPASPVFRRLRTTGGSGLVNNRTNLTSNEIRSDRQIIENRLGQNQPDATIPFELSYDSYDELIQGALGGSWSGGYTMEANASVTTGGVFTLTGVGEEWVDYGAQVGDYVVIQGVLNTDIFGEIGIVSGADMTVYEIGTTTPVTTVVETEDFTFVTGHYAEEIDASTNTITVAATGQTITRASGSWIALGVEAGDKIYFSGFSTGANNGWVEVESLTATVLTIRNGSLVDETLSTGTLSLVTSTGFLTVGTGLDYFGLEEGFTDVDSGTDINGDAVTDGVFHNIIGAYVSNYSMNIQPDSMITGEFQFQGLKYSGFLNASQASAVQESNINNVFDSFTGNLFIPNAPDIQAFVTGLNFTLDNSLVRRYALMDKDAQSIGEGRSNVTGTINAYFQNADISTLFEKETAIALAIRTEDLSGNSFTFGWPKLRLTSDGRDITENDVTMTVNFQALGGLATDKKKTMYVLRQPAIA